MGTLGKGCLLFIVDLFWEMKRAVFVTKTNWATQQDRHGFICAE